MILLIDGRAVEETPPDVPPIVERFSEERFSFFRTPPRAVTVPVPETRERPLPPGDLSAGEETDPPPPP